MKTNHVYSAYNLSNETLMSTIFCVTLRLTRLLTIAPWQGASGSLILFYFFNDTVIQSTICFISFNNLFLFSFDFLYSFFSFLYKAM